MKLLQTYETISDGSFINLLKINTWTLYLPFSLHSFVLYVLAQNSMDFRSILQMACSTY